VAVAEEVMKWNVFFGLWFLILVLGSGIYAFDTHLDRRDFIDQCIVDHYYSENDKVIVGHAQGLRSLCDSLWRLRRG
jgi:hypothetical protein